VLAHADVSTYEDANGVTVMVYGRVSYGDDEKVASEIRAAGPRFNRLELNSWGGSGRTGFALAKYVRKHRTPVYISNRCDSACSFAAMVALGQRTLTVMWWVGQIGVHQAHDDETLMPDVPWTIDMVGRLRRLGAPRKLLDAMVATGPFDMTSFDSDDLEPLGAKVRMWWPLE